MKIEIVKGMGLEVLEEPEWLPNTETRWGNPNEEIDTLHSGKFIVDYIRRGEAHLSDADWDYTGRVTFHSSKHGHLVQVRRLKIFIKMGKIKIVPGIRD